MTRRHEEQRLSQLVFYGTVLLIGWLAWRIVQPFLAEIGWAVVLAICLGPVRRRMEPRLGRTRSALVLTVLVFLVVVVPVVFIAMTLIKEGAPAVAYVEAQLKNQGGPAAWFHQAWEWLRARAPFLPTEQDVDRADHREPRQRAQASSQGRPGACWPARPGSCSPSSSRSGRCSSCCATPPSSRTRCAACCPSAPRRTRG